jgi:hypothetical protein
MNNLTREDWIEIYYALTSKQASVDSGNYGDDDERIGEIAEWSKHLETIIDKIGPDGENMNIEPAKVVVCVEGGVVCGAYSTDKSINIEVWDWDDRVESEEGTTAILSDKFEKITEGMDVIL